jgi:hypothetical protein
MQSDNKELYKLTAARTGKSEQIYKDVGTAVFAALYKSLRKPKSIIIKLKGVGRWYLRKNRLEATVEGFDENKENTNEPDSKEFLKYEDRLELHHIFKKRLEEYREFIKIRNETKERRIAGKESRQNNPS